MKKNIILITLLLIGVLVNAQIEFNGIELGSKQQGSMMITTTYADVSGVILLNKIPVLDSIYQITFYPSDDGASIANIEDSIARRIVKSIEYQYDIKFLNVEGSKENDVFYKTIKENVEYGYRLTSYEKNSKVQLMIWFVNLELEKFK